MCHPIKSFSPGNWLSKQTKQNKTKIKYKPKLNYIKMKININVNVRIMSGNCMYHPIKSFLPWKPNK